MTSTVQPFFIIGFQRSGTTLLRVMLDNHPDVAVPLDVTGLWARYYTRLSDYNDLVADEDVCSLVTALVDEERIRLWETGLTAEDVLAARRKDGFASVMEAFYVAHASKKGKKFWGDKDPGNMLHVHLIRRWFPQCKIIHLIRDGRDACLSLVKQPFGPNNLLSCAREWREQVWWVCRIGEILGRLNYHELKYEDLIRDPERELQNLCDFLGIPYSEQMLSYPDHISASVPIAKRHIWPLIDKPPQRSNAGHWKQELSKGARLCFEKRTHELLEELSYEVLSSSFSGAYTYELRSLLQTAWEAVRRRATFAHHCGGTPSNE